MLSNIHNEIIMSLTFLCSKCRSWLQQHQPQLPERCEYSYKWGIEKYRSGDFKNALNGIGSAYEMAEMMLKSPNFQNDFACKSLISISEVLIKVLDDLNRIDDTLFIQKKTDALLSHVNKGINYQELNPELAKFLKQGNTQRNHLSFVN